VTLRFSGIAEKLTQRSRHIGAAVAHDVGATIERKRVIHSQPESPRRARRKVWLIAAALLQSLTYFWAAGVWHVALKRRRGGLTITSLVPIALAMLLTNQAFPTAGLSGSIIVVRALRKRRILPPLRQALRPASLRPGLDLAQRCPNWSLPVQGVCTMLRCLEVTLWLSFAGPFVQQHELLGFLDAPRMLTRPAEHCEQPEAFRSDNR
jgi:hypothetical protein